MAFHAFRIHCQTVGGDARFILPPAVTACSSFAIWRFHCPRSWSLKGLFKHTSSDWTMLVRPPGITDRSEFSCRIACLAPLSSDHWSTHKAVNQAEQGRTDCVDVQVTGWLLDFPQLLIFPWLNNFPMFSLDRRSAWRLAKRSRYSGDVRTTFTVLGVVFFKRSRR